MSQTVPGFVYTPDLIKQAEASEKWQRTEARRDRRSKNGWRAYALMVTTLLALSVSALNYTIPGIRLLPILLWQSQDGVTGAAITTDTLPADLSDSSLKAWLWQYVMHRESYSWIESDYNHYVVESMSDVPVRERYDAWISGKNKDSPQVVYGHRCVVRVGLREVDDNQWRKPTDVRPGHFTVHFSRQIVCEGEPRQVADTWTASLEFVSNYSRGLNVRDILEFNPSRIVVVNYADPLPLPAKPNEIIAR